MLAQTHAGGQAPRRRRALLFSPNCDFAKRWECQLGTTPFGGWHSSCLRQTSSGACEVSWGVLQLL